MLVLEVEQGCAILPIFCGFCSCLEIEQDFENFENIYFGLHCPIYSLVKFVQIFYKYYCGLCFSNVVGDALDCHHANSVLHSAAGHQHGVREESAWQLFL